MSDKEEVSTDDASQDSNPERRKRRYVANLAFGAIKAQHSANRTRLERFVDGLNQIASSTLFLVAHFIAFAFWLLWNTGKLGIPEDIAHAVSFFADERASFVTGQVLIVDGGRSVGGTAAF